MRIKRLKVSNFRNFSQLEVAFSAGANIFHGPNGSGKTNLLEAIFVLSLGRSHRGAQEAVLLKQGETVYRVSGVIGNDEEHEVAVAYQRGARKKITIDQVPVKIAELYERHCVVTLGPEDSAIVSGSPSTRRNFLDLYLSQSSPDYLDRLITYHKALAQKNACLKSELDPAPFNELLLDSGAAIMKHRSAFLNELQPAAAGYYADISGGGRFTLVYRPSVPMTAEPATVEQLKHAFRESLQENEARERVMKISLVGPHRDDVHLRIDDYPARTHGSQGEWRTAAIALKLAVYNLLAARRKSPPVLLLDEVFAELDQHRTEQLVNAIGKLGQLFLTTAVEPPAPWRQDSRRFKIINGAIREVC
jgi:DNA replication and repair protein RecF